MPHSVPVEEIGLSVDSKTAPLNAAQESEFLSSEPNSSTHWDQTTIAALALLGILWAVKLYTTWGAWGSLTIDSGHEMYVPWLLAEGKQLYRDTFYSFGPVAPYLTSYLYRLFGVRLEVLYWAGSISALASAVFLYLTGRRLGSHFVGWTAGAVLLTEAFQPSLFSFPLPYTFAAVYGCLVGCLFLWLIVSAVFSPSRTWLYAAGTASAVALLIKPEFGITCYCCLAFLILNRLFIQKNWVHSLQDVFAVLPGVAICAIVVRWMISIAGAAFLTEENILSWPNSYFMRTYGKAWLERSGFTVSPTAFLGALHRLVPVIGVMGAAYLFLRWRKYDVRSLLIRVLILFALALYFIKENYFLLAMKEDLTLLLTMIFFPPDMVLDVIAAALVAGCICLWRRTPRNLAIALVFAYSGLLAFRVLMKTNSAGYSIFYNGPVVLSYLLLLCLVIPRSGRARRFVLASEAAICFLVLSPVYLRTQEREAEARNYVLLSTDRGSVRVSKHMAESYTAAIQFMKEKAALGESVLSVPEDTSLYFFSETECPTRLSSFIPGVMAPGKMTDDTIRQIDQKPVRYLLWSNRTFSEYGAKTFGVDFDQRLGDYLKSHYRKVGPLIPRNDGTEKWSADVWERIPDSR